MDNNCGHEPFKYNVLVTETNSDGIEEFISMTRICFECANNSDFLLPKEMQL